VYVGLSLLVPVGTFLVYCTRQEGFPVLTGLFVLAFVFSFWNDNHAVRETKTPPRRISFDTALAKWAGQSTGQRPILVATAGGGSRAAYWTVTVLGAVQDHNPTFAQRLFAISSVSGGSLGAEVFVASLLASADCKHAGTMPARNTTTCIEARGQAALDHDFLGPTAAAGLMPDLLQRFLPWGFLPDRARALERAWESGFAHATAAPDDGVLAQPFTAQWPPADDKAAPWLAALLLNGTHTESGRRIVTSNLDLQGVLRDSYEYFAYCKRDIRGSTAANNSARFPYVAAAGTLPPDCGELRGHIVDGGYFENNGADTLRDLLDTRPDLCSRRPIVVQIVSDPDLKPQDFDKIVPPHEIQGADHLAHETLTPLFSLLNPRGARGMLSMKTLRDKAETCGGSFFLFRMHDDTTVPLPLGWVLSDAAQEEIWKQLDDSVNGDAWKQLTALLDAGKR
jgi:hypothetical protein